MAKSKKVLRANLFSNSANEPLGAGNSGTVGLISSANSVLATVAAQGANVIFAADTTVNEQLVVSRRNSNIVSLFRPTHTAIADGIRSTTTTWAALVTSRRRRSRIS